MPDPTIPSTTDLMRSAARLVDEALSSRGWASQPTVLLHLTTAAEGGVELGMAPVDGHPADILVGSVAPEQWVALGMSQLGWARSVTSSDPHRRVRATTLLSRAAEEVTLLRDERSSKVEELPSTSTGRVSDVLRRCLGLPTPPPGDVPVAWFAAGLWLSRLALAASESEQPLSWCSALGLHPVAIDNDAGIGDVADATLGVVGRTSWEDLRWQTVEGRWAVPGMPPTLASWFDDGAFARWTRSDAGVVDQVVAGLAAEAAERLHAVLVALDLR